MCGIIGYVGKREVAQVLLDGLSRVEYRGYDSAGIAVLGESGINVIKATGKLANLKSRVGQSRPQGWLGIGHTRWATHGRVTEANAHPHIASGGRVALIHNGIIENYQTLKKKYLADEEFLSETDTEVAAKLLGKMLAREGDLHAAMRATMKELAAGAYAFCAISADQPNQFVVARRSSPLIIGVGEGENFVGSDVPAILPYTNKIIYLEDGESARITPDSVEVFDVNGKPRAAKPKTVNMTLEAAEKSGYEHFMLKEINEQPAVIESTLAGRVSKSGIDLSELGLTAAQLKRIKRIQLIAAGTSHYAALTGKLLIEEFARIPVEAPIASEYSYSNPVIDKDVLAIAISQSGESADTKVAMELAKKNGALTMAISNVMGSSIPRMVDATLYTRAGIEIGVAATKTYMAQLTALTLFAAWLGRKRGEFSATEEKKLVADLKEVPVLMRKLLASKLVGVKRCAARYQNVYNFMYMGRNYNYATAFEGALKLKEISYIHAEGYGAGEMKHGPIALMEGTFPTIMICVDSPIRDKVLSNMREIKARDGVIVAVASEGDEEIKELSDYLIYVPRTREQLSPMMTVVPLQLLAYYTAINRGCDPDQPRNLAKSVTVE
ncbi:MAG: glutamine--fructose-6-phosphate transaminase (isomerizing) [Planctomycetes bacterium]|nr:glutamine--fructose-6-phosphate transaminase (isomerizing) [Planctomycetota bacterium]NUQ33974.1 glutamine--fructose-6-phosphate transaminase (isomerizing) [Planctomycetaceae bacterium]